MHWIITIKELTNSILTMAGVFLDLPMGILVLITIFLALILREKKRTTLKRKLLKMEEDLMICLGIQPP